MKCKGESCSTSVIKGFCHVCRGKGLHRMAPKAFRGPILDHNGVRPGMGLSRLKREARENWLRKMAKREDVFLLPERDGIVIAGKIQKIAKEESRFFL